MIVDSPATWHALGGRRDAPLPPLAAADAAAFPGALSRALAPAAAWRRAPADAAPAPWAVLACADAPRSQYDVLREWTDERGSASAPLACVALGGDGCHGQEGRSWAARPGNLHLSAFLPCDLSHGGCAAVLPALPAVAVCEALAALVPRSAFPHAGIKWVNDILVGGAKLAGVLTAVRTVGDRITQLVLGVGVNVATAPAVPGVRTACIADLVPGGGPSLLDVLAAILDAVLLRRDDLQRRGAGPLLEDYRRLSLVTGELVEVRDAPGQPPVVRGRVDGIASDLALQLAGHASLVRGGRLRLLSGPSAAPGSDARR